MPLPLTNFRIALVGTRCAGKGRLVNALQSHFLCRQAPALTVADITHVDGITACEHSHLVLLTVLEAEIATPAGKSGEPTDPAAQTDRDLRAALHSGDIAYQVIGGAPAAAFTRALIAVEVAMNAHAQRQMPERPASSAAPRWRHLCGRCGDPECERRLFAATAQVQGITTAGSTTPVRLP